MKTAELVRDIRKAAKARGITAELVRHGKAHDIWRVGEVQVAIPRHIEIGPKMAFEVRRQLEPALGRNWWR